MRALHHPLRDVYIYIWPSFPLKDSYIHIYIYVYIVPSFPTRNQPAFFQVDADLAFARRTAKGTRRISHEELIRV